MTISNGKPNIYFLCFAVGLAAFLAGSIGAIATYVRYRKYKHGKDNNDAERRIFRWRDLSKRRLQTYSMLAVTGIVLVVAFGYFMYSGVVARTP